MVAFDVKGKARQRALLLYLAGPEVEHIFSTLPDTGEEDDYQKAEEKLSAYFAPKKNVLYERYVFRQASQDHDDTFDKFYTHLRHLSATCDFKEPDEEMKTQLVEHCRSSQVRRKAFRDEPSLEELVTYARALEVSDHQTKEVERKTKFEAVNYHTNNREHRQKVPKARNQTCYKCGGL